MTDLLLRFDSDNKELAECLGEALTRYGSGVTGERSTPDEIGSDYREPGSDEGAYQAWLGEGGDAALQHVADYTGYPIDELHEATAKRSVAADNVVDINGGGESLMTDKEIEAGDKNLAETSGKVDEKGVPFNAEMCGNAAKPFYASGKNQGQWKKKQGVDEDDYNAWYAGALSEITAEPAAEQKVDTGAAFGGGAESDPVVQSDAPTEVGPLMQWVSEQTAAGNLTQPQVTQAYAQAELEMQDVFPSAERSAEETAANIKKVYDILFSWVQV